MVASPSQAHDHANESNPYNNQPLTDEKIVWLVVFCLMSCSKILHAYGEVNITSDEIQNLGLRSSLYMAYEQERISMVTHLL